MSVYKLLSAYLACDNISVNILSGGTAPSGLIGEQPLLVCRLCSLTGFFWSLEAAGPIGFLLS
jgi:hypothetical protein